ncbi:MAG: trypsin-like serine protease [Roseomonas sp.]|nr:trypsin-like serine protease [Roseomonas sp.]
MRKQLLRRVPAVLAGLAGCIATINPVLAQTASLDPAPTMRIIGGLPARAGTWPSMVSVQFANRNADGQLNRERPAVPLCGGTVIGASAVLTAAHCVVLDGGRVLPPRALMVEEGTTDILQGRGRRIQVSAIHAHPQYRAEPATNDVAILILQQPSGQPRQLLLGAADRAAVLSPGAMATVAGWGQTREGRDAPTSNRLLQVNLPLVSQQDCQRVYANGVRPGSLGDHTLCAGFRDGGRDSCQGDSGGPLFANGRTGTVQIGVVSWGEGCARAGRPGVYASVGHFESWIRRHVPDADFTGRSSAAAQPPAPSPGPSPAPPRPPRPAEVTDARCFAPFRTPPEVAPSQTAQLTIDIEQGNSLRIGTAITFRIQSSIEGALVVFAINPAGEPVVLFPNPRAAGFMPGQATQRMTPGQTMLLPGPADGFRAVVQPPAGGGVVCAAVLPQSPETRALLGSTPALTPIADPDGFRARLDRAVDSARQGNPGGVPTNVAVASRLYEVVP